MFDRRLRRNLARHSQCSQGLSMRTQLGTQSGPCEHSGCQHMKLMYLVDLHLGHVCLRICLDAKMLWLAGKYARQGGGTIRLQEFCAT